MAPSSQIQCLIVGGLLYLGGRNNFWGVRSFFTHADDKDRLAPIRWTMFLHVATCGLFFLIFLSFLISYFLKKIITIKNPFSSVALFWSYSCALAWEG